MIWHLPSFLLQHYGTKVSPETIIKVEFFFPKMNAHFRLANYWLSKTGDIPTAQKSKSALSVKTPWEDGATDIVVVVV